MPRVFKIGNYVIFFWINEGVPLELKFNTISFIE